MEEGRMRLVIVCRGYGDVCRSEEREKERGGGRGRKRGRGGGGEGER